MEPGRGHFLLLPNDRTEPHRFGKGRWSIGFDGRMRRAMHRNATRKSMVTRDVGPNVVGGKIIASLALGQRDEWSQCGLATAAARSFP